MRNLCRPDCYSSALVPGVLIWENLRGQPVPQHMQDDSSTDTRELESASIFCKIQYAGVL